MSRRCWYAFIACLVTMNGELRSAPVPVPKDDRSPEEIQAARNDLDRLRRRIADPHRDPAELWNLWAQFRMRHAGSPEYLQAAEVMSKVPSPLDKLDRSQIPAEDRTPWLPKEVVAVLGDQRGRCWGNFGRLSFSRDGKLLFSHDQAWDAATLRERLYPHKRGVLSPDGKWAAELAGVKSPEAKRHFYLDKLIRLLEVRGDEFIVRAEIKRELHDLNYLAWSPDGRMLLASGQYHAHLHDSRPFTQPGIQQQTILCEVKANKLRLLHVIEAEPNGGQKAAFAVNGKYLVDDGGRRHAVRLWDLLADKPKLHATIPNVKRGDFSLSADGRILALPQPSRLRGRNADAVAVWTLTEAGEQPPRFFEGSWRWLGRVELRPDGTLLVCLALDHKGIWLCPLTEARRRELGMKKGEDSKYFPLTFVPHSFCFDSDCRKMAIGGTDRIIHLWDWKKGEKVIAHRGHRGSVADICFAPDGGCLASTGDDGTIRFWEWDGGSARERLHVDEGRPLGGIALAPDGETLAAYAYALYGLRERKDAKEDRISFWDVRKKRPVRLGAIEPHAEDRDFASMAFAARGKILLTTGHGLNPRGGKHSELGTACFWDCSSVPPRLMSRIHLEDAEKKGDNSDTDLHLSSVTLSPTGKQLAFLDHWGTSAQVWELRGESWHKAFELKFDRDEAVDSLVFSKDGTRLILGGHGCQEGRPFSPYYPLIRFWKTRGRVGEIRPSLKVGSDGIARQLLLSPDGRRIAVRAERRIAIWDLPTSRKVMEWGPSVSDFVDLFEFAPDGRHLATANANGTVYLFRIPEQSAKP
jgi:WD40 repeat protein